MKQQNDMPRVSSRYLWPVLILASILGSCVIFYHATHTLTYTIDSYVYLSKAKQLAAGHGLRTTWNDGVDTKYFPGYSIFLALPFLVGGSYISVQIISYLLCALLLLAIAKEIELEPTVQLLVATAFVANPIVIKWCSVPMAEGVALALSLLSVLLFIRFAKTKNYSLVFAACMVGGVAVITRLESLFLLAVFGVVIFPLKKTISWPRLLAGGALFIFPLAAYWVRLRGLGVEGPAYLGEFRHTFMRFHLLKNLAYNVWVPFGFMHRPVEFLRPVGLAALAGTIWIVVGELVFLGGLICSLFGRLGPKVRAIGLLFLAYALVHSFWYYRYERFMLMAIPLAAIIWAAMLTAVLTCFKGEKKGRAWILILTQLLIVTTGIYLGNHYSVRHREELEQDTGGLKFQHIAEVVNTLNRQSCSPVLTDLGPHLAYYLDAHTYMDSKHGNYWQRAFPLENTLEEIAKRDIGFIVTKKDLASWLEQHKIPTEAMYRFKRDNHVEGVVIIRYSPS